MQNAASFNSGRFPPYRRHNNLLLDLQPMTRQRIDFCKMNGIGNAILIADMRGRDDCINENTARILAEPGALPFDQIMEVHDPAGPGRDLDIRIINTDGSLAEACGNGTRCVVAWLHREQPKSAYRFVTPAGTISASLGVDGVISVDMGEPRFAWHEIPLAEEFADTTGIELQIGPVDAPVLHIPSVANLGNPHAIFWVEKDVWEYDLERFGPLLENHSVFPERANITIARIVAPDRIVIRTWERGAGLTLACGSAACATLVCAVRKGIANRKATIKLPGGELVIEWRDDNHVMMSGPVAFEFEGELDPQSGAFSRLPAAEEA
jgi:diaminopimelate epimerase